MADYTDSHPPLITFIIVARNAAQYVNALLTDYARQDYPADLRELIFVDGLSEDGTKRLAQEFKQRHPELVVTILDNPKRTLASGWNLGLRTAGGDIVCRVDAHASIAPDYLQQGVRLLLELEKDAVACVGGSMQTVGQGFWGRAIARVLSSPFGVGNAKFRYATKPEFVDTVPYGLYWRRVFDKVGLFREELDRGQDTELHARIRAQGWKFFLSPALKITYNCRSTIPGFVHQAFGNGYSVVILWRQCSWRHLIPFGFVAALAFLIMGSLRWPLFSVILGGLGLLYALMAFYYGAKITSWSKSWLDVVLLPPLFFLHHMSYGLGSWWALLCNNIGLKNNVSQKKNSNV